MSAGMTTGTSHWTVKSTVSHSVSIELQPRPMMMKQTETK